MTDDPLSDTRILASWRVNAAPWTRVVRDGEIESRRLVTDRAIVEAVLDGNPKSVLDIGCGEGWLTRALAVEGITVTGVDAVAELIEQARQAAVDDASTDFRVMSYEEIAAGKLMLSVDAAVCNFALLGKETVEGLFAAMGPLLKHDGRVLVQTLHPRSACGEAPYMDGWREGSWAGFSAAFRDPAPWYFRTMESWRQLFEQNGFRLIEVREPRHPQTRQPVSVIFIARRGEQAEARSQDIEFPDAR